MKASASGRMVVCDTKTLQCLHQAVRTLAHQAADLKEPCSPFSIPFLPFPSSIPLLLDVFPAILLLLFLLPSFLYLYFISLPLLLPPPPFSSPLSLPISDSLSPGIFPTNRAAYSLESCLLPLLARELHNSPAWGQGRGPRLHLADGEIKRREVQQRTQHYTAHV